MQGRKSRMEKNSPRLFKVTTKLLDTITKTTAEFMRLLPINVFDTELLDMLCQLIQFVLPLTNGIRESPVEGGQSLQVLVTLSI
jgi:hypothetical protein